MSSAPGTQACRRAHPRMFAVGVALAGATASSTVTALTVVGFGGSTQEAFRQAYFEPFRQESGVTLIEDSYQGGYARQKAMVESGQVTWDLIQTDDNEMASACEEGLLEIIDRAQLGDTRDIMPAAFARCGVGGFVWSKVLTYDARRFGDDGPRTWADFWDTRRWPGKRGLRKQPRMTLEIALLADGVPPADLYKVLATRAGQDRAFAKLEQLRPSVVWWETGAQPLEWLESGTLAVTAAYSGRVAHANQQGKTFRFSWENQLYAMDYWTIVKGSPNRAEAYQLLASMQRADRQAHFAQIIPYGITNIQAQQNLPAALQQQLPTAPQNLINAVRLDPDFWLDHEEELMQRFTRWVSQR